MIKIILLNVHSILSPERQKLLQNFLKVSKPDVVLLQEAKIKDGRLNLPNYTVHTNQEISRDVFRRAIAIKKGAYHITTIKSPFDEHRVFSTTFVQIQSLL